MCISGTSDKQPLNRHDRRARNLHYVTIHVPAKVLWFELNYRFEEDREAEPSEPSLLINMISLGVISTNSY